MNDNKDWQNGGGGEEWMNRLLLFLVIGIKNACCVRFFPPALLSQVSVIHQGPPARKFLLNPIILSKCCWKMVLMNRNRQEGVFCRQFRNRWWTKAKEDNSCWECTSNIFSSHEKRGWFKSCAYTCYLVISSGLTGDNWLQDLSGSMSFAPSSSTNCCR